MLHPVRRAIDDIRVMDDKDWKEKLRAISLHGLLGFLGEGKNAKQRRDTKMSKWLKEWNIVQFQCYNSW